MVRCGPQPTHARIVRGICYGCSQTCELRLLETGLKNHTFDEPPDDPGAQEAPLELFLPSHPRRLQAPVLPSPPGSPPVSGFFLHWFLTPSIHIFLSHILKKIKKIQYCLALLLLLATTLALS